MKLIFPCNYIGITQGYKTSHEAIDMGWDTNYGGPNHKIIAPEDGVVTYVKSNVKTRSTSSRTYGNYIKIKHNNEVTTLMAHLKYGSIKVKVGDKVKRGQTIASMGNTGYSFGVHCHYEVIVNKTKVNPLKYTYYTSGQIVGTNTKKKYNPSYLESEGKEVNSDIRDKETKPETNNDVKIEVSEPIKIESDDVIFEYVCNKTGMYKIHLNEGEKLVIKD